MSQPIFSQSFNPYKQSGNPNMSQRGTEQMHSQRQSNNIEKLSQQINQMQLSQPSQMTQSQPSNIEDHFFDSNHPASSRTITEVSSQMSMMDKAKAPMSMIPSSVNTSHKNSTNFKPQHLSFNQNQQQSSDQLLAKPSFQDMQMANHDMQDFRSFRDYESSNQRYPQQQFSHQRSRQQDSQDEQWHQSGYDQQVHQQQFNYEGNLNMKALEQSLQEAIEQAVNQAIGDNKDQFKYDLFDQETLLALATHNNPAIMYLYNEIEKTDQAFHDLQVQASKQITELTDEWQQLKQEIQGLQEQLNEDVEEPFFNIDQQFLEENKDLQKQRRFLAETLIKMSEDMMRDARGDKILMFLKLRYPDHVNIEDDKQCKMLKSMFDEFQQKLSQKGALNLDRETKAVHEFLHELESMGYVPKLKQPKTSILPKNFQAEIKQAGMKKPLPFNQVEQPLEQKKKGKNKSIFKRGRKLGQKNRKDPASEQIDAFFGSNKRRVNSTDSMKSQESGSNDDSDNDSSSDNSSDNSSDSSERSFSVKGKPLKNKKSFTSQDSDQLQALMSETNFAEEEPSEHQKLQNLLSDDEFQEETQEQSDVRTLNDIKNALKKSMKTHGQGKSKINNSKAEGSTHLGKKRIQ
eukprot:403336589